MNATTTKIGHVHIKVRDLDRAGDFYTNVLGLKISEAVTWISDAGRSERYLFLSFGDEHHDVALKEVGPDAELPKDEAVGLFHFAIEVPTAEVFCELYRRVVDAGIQVGPVDHFISKALYFRDPDNNGIEIYLDTRHQNGRSSWLGENAPLDMMALQKQAKATPSMGVT